MRMTIAFMATAAVSSAALPTLAMDLVRQETQTDLAVQEIGASGNGVLIAILDRGIDWTHQDFIRSDGQTRIRWMLDMTGFNLCNAGNPPAIEYSSADINAALSGGPSIPFRDAVGHGTVTAGIAAGDGSAFAGGKYRGIASDADLIIVKVISEGAPAHHGQPAEAAFQGCILQALDWLDAKIDEANQPCVALINSGTQWGPMDGTSAVSRKIDEVFGEDRAGRVYVAASGDEGNINNHAAGTYDNGGATTVSMTKVGFGTSFASMWYTGSEPASITLTFADGTVVGPVPPGGWIDSAGVFVIQYTPGIEFYPWQSTSGDRAVWIRIIGHGGQGSLKIQGTTPGTGQFHAYGSADGAIRFNDHLADGRLTDYATTQSAIVAGAHVVRTSYFDIDGIFRFVGNEGGTGQLWTFSSPGPTRDGRLHGVDLTAPGHNCFAAYGPNSYWGSQRFSLVQDGGGWYGRAGATSGSAPIVLGMAALMLELRPDLTAADVRQVLRNTSTQDGMTGIVPNANWGFGKINALAALNEICPEKDLDCDGDWDADDVEIWGNCVSGPAGSPLEDCTASRFRRADLDGDQDVDLVDYAELQVRFEG